MIFLLMKKIVICYNILLFIKYHFSGQEEKEMSF